MKNKANIMPGKFYMSSFASGLDLAVEANSLLRGDDQVELPGVKEEKLSQNGAEIHIITVLDEQGAELMGRPCGRYITIDTAGSDISSELPSIAAAAADQLNKLLPPPKKNSPLLVVGLGNSSATPDSLGPRVVEKTCATRHLFQQKNIPQGVASVCAIAPGVLGNSGIETAEIIRGICRHICPRAVIAADSLAAASVTRVGTTIQLTDTGIKPGSGLGNHRTGIDKELAGCPVIAIGIPTVVDSAAIIAETADAIYSYWHSMGISAPIPDREACSHAEASLLSRFSGRLMVTPKDIDALIAKDAELIAAAIAMAVHPGADKDNYYKFMY